MAQPDILKNEDDFDTTQDKSIPEAKNWQWQMRNQVTSLTSLLAWLKENAIYNKLPPATLETLREWENYHDSWIDQFQFAVTPYYLSLVDWQNPACPILGQLLPSSQEFQVKTKESLDPLQEEANMPLASLTHRYPDRVLWYLSHRCAMYCRFCTRKRKVSQPSSSSGHRHWDKIFMYISEHKEIKEVILSGGDPLSLGDTNIAYILQKLRKIRHLYSIRIHTRMPVTLPARITTALVKVLQDAYPITIVTHFNCKQELTLQARQAVRLLRMHGTDVLNQSVLLKGINDTAKWQEDLLLSLVATGIKPYYLHRCDEIIGTEHFRVSFRKGIEILSQLRGRNPGIALPRYVVDLPGGGGKVPLEPNYLLGEVQAKQSGANRCEQSKNTTEERYRVYNLNNWEGKEFYIHEPYSLEKNMLQ